MLGSSSFTVGVTGSILKTLTGLGDDRNPAGIGFGVKRWNTSVECFTENEESTNLILTSCNCGYNNPYMSKSKNFAGMLQMGQAGDKRLGLQFSNEESMLMGVYTCNYSTIFDAYCDYNKTKTRLDLCSSLDRYQCVLSFSLEMEMQLQQWCRLCSRAQFTSFILEDKDYLEGWVVIMNLHKADHLGYGQDLSRYEPGAVSSSTYC